jgi:hypothetical protein
VDDAHEIEPSGTPRALPQAGWQLDGDTERWWSGTAWTDYRRNAQVVTSAPTIAVPASTAAVPTARPARSTGMVGIAASDHPVDVFFARVAQFARTHRLLSGLLALLAVGLLGEAVASSHSPTLPPGAPSGAVGGSFSTSCAELTCNTQQAADELSASGVYCFWRGNDVIVNLTLHNGMAAKIAPSILPRYQIENGATHGQSFGSEVPTTVPASGSRTISLDAGHPLGVPDDTAISNCEPRLDDVTLSN